MIGAKIAMVLSFKNSANKYMFKNLAKFLQCETQEDISVDFEAADGKIDIGSIDRCKISIKNGFVPLGISFGTHMSHQGAVIVRDEIILLYEPYGLFQKKIQNITYDYYDLLEAEFSQYGRVENFHEYVGIDKGIQKIVLDRAVLKYDEFLCDFSVWIGHLRKTNPKMVDKLRDKLSRIDITSESSKFAYLVEAASIVRGDCAADALHLYMKYSPYSCVSFTLVEIADFFGQNTRDLYKARDSDEIWNIIARVVEKVAPKFFQFIRETPICKLMSVQIWDQY